MSAPAFILVRPQMGENIGAAARAMKNFGLHDLRLVAPRDGWPNPKAVEMAAHAADLIETATVYASTREAIADVQYLYASTARSRSINKPQLTPRNMTADILQRGKTAVLFGPERSGLENEDIALAHALVTIPTDENHASLNIAQASVVLAYEWWQSDHAALGELPQTDQTAPANELHALFDHLEQALDRTYFFKQDEKKPRMWINLRHTLLKAGLSSQEVHSLRGVIAALEKGEKRK